MATQHLIERWIHTVVTIAVVVLLYAAAILYARTAIPEFQSPTEPGDSLIIGCVLSLAAYGIVTRLYLAFHDDRSAARITKKEQRAWQRSADLLDHVLFGQIGWREDWIRARLRELEQLESDPELEPLVRWRFRAVLAVGVAGFLTSLALRYVTLA